MYRRDGARSGTSSASDVTRVCDAACRQGEGMSLSRQAATTQHSVDACCPESNAGVAVSSTQSTRVGAPLGNAAPHVAGAGECRQALSVTMKRDARTGAGARVHSNRPALGAVELAPPGLAMPLERALQHVERPQRPRVCRRSLLPRIPAVRTARWRTLKAPAPTPARSRTGLSTAGRGSGLAGLQSHSHWLAGEEGRAGVHPGGFGRENSRSGRLCGACCGAWALREAVLLAERSPTQSRSGSVTSGPGDALSRFKNRKGGQVGVHIVW